MKLSDHDFKAKVLIVDDMKLMREILRKFLESDGYLVQSASNGVEAWQLLNGSEQPFDIVVTDRDMPQMDGMELLTKIKGDPRFTELPVIFQTGISSRDAIVEGINAGVYHYLTKPYDEKVLLAFVASAIDDSRRHKALKTRITNKRVALSLLRKAEFGFRTLNEIKGLTTLLADLSCNSDKVATGLSELLLNAVEHGNLGISYQEKTELVSQGRWREEIERRLNQPEYQDKFVLVKIVRETSRTTFTIKDQGQGFDPSNFLTFSPERATDLHGRGIALSRMLSFDSLDYLGNGNQVVATVNSASN
ncbi:response regulator [Methylomonas rosea]|uniref:Response regulator n=1 Tax=Methylomonas rosea TaxID=2952227 RepID=A0ABT1TW50_9GAMM|nr:response regulator [Methylomonas sp. WSC-7]MCQ8119005.1 response regulator [Methylomonas sp. WSC-7]